MSSEPTLTTKVTYGALGGAVVLGFQYGFLLHDWAPLLALGATQCVVRALSAAGRLMKERALELEESQDDDD
jgi:hypothetical protein